MFNHRKMRSQQSRIGGVIMGPNNNQYCTSLRPDPHDDDVSNWHCVFCLPHRFSGNLHPNMRYIIWYHDEVLLKQVKPWRFSEALGSLMASVCHSLPSGLLSSPILRWELFSGSSRCHGMVGMKWPLLGWSVIFWTLTIGEWWARF